MSIRKLRAGRVPVVTANHYVGEYGAIFWDETDGQLRLSDGHTLGGKVLNPAVAASSTTPPPSPYEGELWYNPSTKELWAYYNGAFRGTINPATPTELGGIKAGPGVVIASDGTLTLDSTGIPFNFGDFYAFTNTGPHDGACLSSINANQDVNLVSNGTGSINLVGTFHVHTTDNTVEGALSVSPVFSVENNGLTKIHTPAPPLGTSVLAVSSNISESLIPLAAGAMGAVLQLAGANDSSTTIAVDTFSNIAASSSNFTFRRYRGTLDTPLAVQSGDLMAAIGSTAFDGTGTATLPAQVTSIRFVATENQTLTAKGSRIDMYAIPTGTAARTLNLSLLGTQVSVPLDTQSTSTTSGALVTAGGIGVAKDARIGGTVYGTSFVGNLTGNVNAGAVTTTNITVTGNVTAGNVIANTIGTLYGNVSGTVLTSSQPNITSVGTLINLTVDGAGSGSGLTVQGNLRYDIAYGNGTVTQLTDKSTAVTCNGRTGQITTAASSLAKGAAITFTVNNSYVTAVTDLPIVAIQSGATINSYAIAVTRVQSGNFNITITNNGTGALSDTIIINFAVMKIS